MEEKYTNIKERLLFYAKNQGIGIEKFLESIGMTYGSFKGKAKKGTLNSDALVEIYTKYPDINIDWLLTGKGEMLKEADIDSKEKKPPEDKRDQYIITLQQKHIEKLENEIEQLKKELKPPSNYRIAAEPDQ